MLNEDERDRGLEAANETEALDRARPLSLRDMLEKEGCRPREKLRTEKLDAMTSERRSITVCHTRMLSVFDECLNNILVKYHHIRNGLHNIV